jgi:hypothetical protein
VRDIADSIDDLATADLLAALPVHQHLLTAWLEVDDRDVVCGEERAA